MVDTLRIDPTSPPPGEDEVCDHMLLVLAAREERTLSEREDADLQAHLARCVHCQAVAGAAHEGAWRWVSRVPETVFEARRWPRGRVTANAGHGLGAGRGTATADRQQSKQHQ